MHNIGIVGAGPAGLAAANALCNNEENNVTIYEEGKAFSKRDHDNYRDLPGGVGGAGVFSDGKFSFFPSSSTVYKLDNRENLRVAYRWLFDKLSYYGIEVPPFPCNIDTFDSSKLYQDSISLKNYISVCSSLEIREKIITDLFNQTNINIYSNQKVIGILKTNEGYKVKSINSNNVVSEKIYSDIVYANGRFGGTQLLNCENSFNIPSSELRYELGIRVETSSGVSFFEAPSLIDIKYLWRVEDSQICTFCTCRDGQLWKLQYDNFFALSGRTDCEKTGYSNFALLARFQKDSLVKGKRIWEYANTNQGSFVIWEPIKEFLGSGKGNVTSNLPRPWYPKSDFKKDSIKRYMGGELHKILTKALHDIINSYPDIYNDETICLYPAIEGVGVYPEINSDLKVLNESIWCAGDVTGRFRGIIPALLSGYYVGLRINNY